MQEIDQAVLDGIAAIEEAYRDVKAAIETGVDGRHGFAAATELGRRLDLLVGDAAGLRAAEVVKIRDTEGVTSLTRLGELVGVSRPRATKFVQAGERYREGTTS